MTPRAALVVTVSTITTVLVACLAAQHYRVADAPDPRAALATRHRHEPDTGLQVSNGALASSSQRSGQPDSGHQSRREPARAPWIPVAEFTREDTERLRFVNGVMDLEGKQQIPTDARILSSDLDVFRTIVDDANHSVQKALQSWRTIANERSAELEQELHAKIGRGETENLPYLSATNRMKRRHPYEAITQVVCESGTFVLRASVDENPLLLEAGEGLDYASRSRALDFETLVRPLFKNGESQ